MEKWDKVFTTGKHTDSSGFVKNWGVEDLDRMVAAFNPSYHEPPVVIGHPSDNAPAFGWVSGIKRVGNDLYLKYRDVSSQFKELVEQGLYKKKSIAVYPDGSLRHVGYLGAMPPAIKGLPDFQFKSGSEFVTYCCDQQTTWEQLKGLLTTMFGNTAMGGDDDAEEDDSNKGENIMDKGVADMANKDQSGGTTEKGEPVYVEALRSEIAALSERIAQLETGITKNKEEIQQNKFREFLGTPEMVARIPEAHRQATIDHLTMLIKSPEITFGEKTVSAVEHYIQQLKQLPTVVTFAEIAKKDNSCTGSGDLTPQDLAKKAVEFQEQEEKAGRFVSMSQAVNHISGGVKQ